MCQAWRAWSGGENQELAAGSNDLPPHKEDYWTYIEMYWTSLLLELEFFLFLAWGLGPGGFVRERCTSKTQDSNNSSSVKNRISKKIADRSTASASDPTASTTTAATPATPATSDAAGDLAAAAAAAADPAAGTPAAAVKNGVTEKLLEKPLDEERWQGDDAHIYY